MKIERAVIDGEEADLMGLQRHELGEMGVPTVSRSWAQAQAACAGVEA